ncbi:MAG: VOC family protein [Ginsengibacter sp.]
MKKTVNLTPFLLFNGNCADAMFFYQQCLGGELSITKVGDTPMKMQMPETLHKRVAYAQLKSNAIEFSATDWAHPTRKFQQGNTVAMYVTGAEYEELKEIFDKLSEGADKSLLDELKNLPFGIYGHLADKFGVHWFFVGNKK